MKNLFLNSQGKNTARFDLIVDNKLMSLYYHLNDNPVQHHWQQNLIANMDLGLDLTLPSAGSLEVWAEKLDSLVRAAGVDYPVTSNVTQEQLNELHAMFVEFESASAFPTDLEQVWIDINTVIHIVETKLGNPLDAYNSTVRFNVGAGYLEHSPIHEYHKNWLDSERQWGSLMLGYDTLGKDWADVWYNNDVALISDPKQLQVQNHIGLETWLTFDIENPWKKYTENKFYNWYMQLTPEQQSQVPIDNLNKLALGRYLLGQVIITDEFLKFNPNASDWYVPNHKCKLEWNRDIISKITSVEKVEFFESDMYFDTGMAHTAAKDIFGD